MSKQRRETSSEARLRSPHGAEGFVRADLKAYLDNELSPLRRWIVKAHLARCAACREEVTWLQRLGKNMAELEAARPRPELRARILATLPVIEPAAPRSPLPLSRDRAGLFNRPAPRFALGVGLLALTVGGVFAMRRLQAHSNGLAQANINPVVVKGAAPVGPKAPTGVKRAPAVVSQQPLAHRPDDVSQYNDPTSKAAEEIVEKQEERQRALDAQQLKIDWKRAVAAARAPKSSDKTVAPAYIPVQVTVADMDRAEKSLQDWAKRSGSVAVVTKTESGETLVLRVSPNHSKDLLAALQKVGPVTLLTTGESSPASAPSVAHPAVPTQDRPQVPVKPRDSVASDATPQKAPMSSVAPPPIVVMQKTPEMITVSVLLIQRVSPIN